MVGILRFIPGITTHYDDLSFAGHESHAKLIGIFQVSILHNLIHVAYRVAGLAVARKPRPAALYLLVGGIVYGVVWLYGLFVEHHSDANFVPLNNADNSLHFVPLRGDGRPRDPRDATAPAGPARALARLSGLPSAP